MNYMLTGNFFTVIDKNFENDRPYAIIRLNPSHFIYKAHFPECPITPGVCQIQIVSEILSDHIGKEVTLVAAKNIKYISVIYPEKEKNITVRFEKLQIDGDSCKVMVVLENVDSVFSRMSMTYRISNNLIR